MSSSNSIRKYIITHITCARLSLPLSRATQDLGLSVGLTLWTSRTSGNFHPTRWTAGHIFLLGGPLCWAMLFRNAGRRDTQHRCTFPSSAFSLRSWGIAMDAAASHVQPQRQDNRQGRGVLNQLSVVQTPPPRPANPISRREWPVLPTSFPPADPSAESHCHQ